MSIKTEIEWKTQTVELYEEPCDCGSQVRHNNGGNYHAVARLVTVSDGEGNAAVVIENTTTREAFPGDDFDVLIFDPHRHPQWELIPEEWTSTHDEPIRRFLTAEAYLLYTLIGGEEQEK